MSRSYSWSSDRFAGSVTPKKSALSTWRPDRSSSCSRKVNWLSASRASRPRFFFSPASTALFDFPMAMNCQNTGSNEENRSCSSASLRSIGAPSVTNMTYTGWVSAYGWERGPAAPK